MASVIISLSSQFSCPTGQVFPPIVAFTFACMLLVPSFSPVNRLIGNKALQSLVDARPGLIPGYAAVYILAAPAPNYVDPFFNFFFEPFETAQSYCNSGRRAWFYL